MVGIMNRNPRRIVQRAESGPEVDKSGRDEHLTRQIERGKSMIETETICLMLLHEIKVHLIKEYDG